MTPTKDDEDWLSQVEAGYIGLEQPKIEKTFEKEESRWDGTDNSPEDPTNVDWNDLHE